MGCLDLQSKVSDELDTIEQKISSLYTYRSGVIREVKRLHARRKDNRIEIENLTIKINSSRDSVKKGYQQYNDIRKSRSTLLSEIRDIRSKIKTIENDLRIFEKNSSLKKNIDLVEELKSADWKLQTEKLTREEERNLVETIKELELKLRSWKKAYSCRQDLNKMRETMVKLKSKLDDLAVSRENIEIEIHTEKDKLSINLKGRDQIFKELDELNNDIAELEDTINNTDKELEALKTKRKNLIMRIRKKEEDLILDREREILNKAKISVKEKLSKGEKLSFEELKLAYNEE
jgi:uncharacterized coiled-coil DUF342 family protein